MEQRSGRQTPSQQQIATHLGVSQALVSMVLNGRSKGINAATHRRIWDHAVAVGYAPKGMRMEANGAAPTQVGFILRAGLTLYTQSNFFSHVQHGLHSFLEAQGRSALFLGTETTLLENDFRNLKQMREHLGGLVIMGEVDLSFLKKVRAQFPRLVTVSASYPGICHSVLNNEAQAIDFLVRHLASLGHRKFAWIGGNAELERHEQRFTAFQRALSQYQCTCLPDAVTPTEEADRMDGRVAASRLLEQLGRDHLPTAWIAYNGPMARGAVNFLLSHQIRIPDDVSIAAVDGTRICEEEEPTLTGAFTDPEKMGAVAGDLLLRATGSANEIFTDAVLPATLTIRESTGPVSPLHHLGPGTDTPTRRGPHLSPNEEIVTSDHPE